MSLLKKKDAPTAGDQKETLEAASAVKPGGKGRPTPKRKDAQARGLHPVVPTDRKAAKKEARRKQDEAWARQREAMVTGDDRYLPVRDKGPIRRYMRDYVDARYSVGELFLPATILLLLIVIGMSAILRSESVATANAMFVLMILIYAIFIVAILDSVLAWVRLRKRLFEKFGEDKVRSQRGNFWYVFSRCFNLRRWRQPVPQVARRQFPS